MMIGVFHPFPGPNNPISHFDYDGELGILYHNELGNDTLPYYETPTITGPFLGIAADTNCYYWYDLTLDNYVAPGGDTYDAAYTFDTVEGSTGVQSRTNLNYVWAVRDVHVMPKNQPSISVISPNGGETLVKGNDYLIQWSRSHYSGYIRIHAYLNDEYFYTISSNEPVKNGNKGVVFNPPGNWPNSDYYKIHISTLDDVASDKSDNYFTITDQSNLLQSFSFPLEGYGPYTAVVTSVLDHSEFNQNPVRFYGNPDGIIEAYNGEIGRKEYGFDCYDKNCKIVGYKNISGSVFLDGYLNYNDVYLFYDGHPGYDFAAIDGTPVKATQSGKLYKAKTDLVNGNNKSKTAWDGFHTFYIDHENGYSSWYLHCSKLSANIENEISEKGFAEVSKGQIVAESGHFPNFASHLHFEVRKDGFNDENVIDPYKENLWE